MHQNVFNFMVGDSMFSTFLPIPIIPVKAREFHFWSVDKCLHIDNIAQTSKLERLGRDAMRSSGIGHEIFCSRGPDRIF